MPSMGLSAPQVVLMISNSVLVVSAMAMVIIGLHFTNAYHMTTLHFLSENLYTFPVTIIALGIINFLVAILGFPMAALSQVIVRHMMWQKI